MDDQQYLENITTLINDLLFIKVNEFEQTIIKNDKFNDLYELKNPIIQRHILIKTIEEINQQLKKDERQFTIDFDEDSHNFFNKQNDYYFRKGGCIADDDGLLYFKAYEVVYGLELLIKNNLDDKELKFKPKRTKTKLQIYIISVF